MDEIERRLKSTRPQPKVSELIELQIVSRLHINQIFAFPREMRAQALLSTLTFSSLSQIPLSSMSPTATTSKTWEVS